MRKLLLGSALAVVLTFGVHGTSFASTTVPVTPGLWLNATGTIQLQNDNDLSNQPREDNSQDDANGNNGSE